jgi:hypothetical protein
MQAKKHMLEEQYPGDNAWGEFARVSDGFWDQCAFKDELVTNLKDLGLAKAVYMLTSDAALDWVFQGVPALDGLRPVDCLVNPVLVCRLRSMLMRMPS